MSGSDEARIRRLEQRSGERPALRSARPLNIIDFATNPLFLGAGLYPPQALILKLVTLSVDLLTELDYQMLRCWTDQWVETHEGDRHVWRGSYGCPPDILQRIESARVDKRPWFNEVALVLGRRAGKGYMARALVAWVCWRLLMMENPQRHYGIHPQKPLQVLLFSTKADQAKRDIFGDTRSALLRPCFEPFRGKVTADRVEFYTPAQLADPARSPHDEPLLVVRAAETTASAARGAAVAMIVMDEVAYIDGSGSTDDAETILAAATPATAQFDNDRLIVLASTPAERIGPLAQAYDRALEIDPETGHGRHPHSFTAQLPTWDLYQHWEETQ